MQQRGVKRKLGVFASRLDALTRHAGALGFVVNHQGAAVGHAVNAVELADQRHRAQGRLFPDLARVERGTAGRSEERRVGKECCR